MPRHRLAIRIEDEDMRAIRAAAKAQGVAYSAIVRAAIRAGLTGLDASGCVMRPGPTVGDPKLASRPKRGPRRRRRLELEETPTGFVLTERWDG